MGESPILFFFTKGLKFCCLNLHPWKPWKIYPWKWDKVVSILTRQIELRITHRWRKTTNFMFFQNKLHTLLIKTFYITSLRHYWAEGSSGRQPHPRGSRHPGSHHLPTPSGVSTWHCATVHQAAPVSQQTPVYGPFFPPGNQTTVPTWVHQGHEQEEGRGVFTQMPWSPCKLVSHYWSKHWDLEVKIQNVLWKPSNVSPVLS